MKARRRSLGPLAAVLFAGGCAEPYGPMLPGGPEARSLATLGWWVIGILAAVAAVMTVLILVAALKRRGVLTEHEPIDVDGGKRWIFVGGLLIPGLILIGLFYLSMTTLRNIPRGNGKPDLVIDITAHQWWWEARYDDPDLQKTFTTANEFHIPVGKNVLINLTSPDVIHSFWVPQLHGKLDAIPGHLNRLTLEAAQPGVYDGECAEYCGAQHAHMHFQVVAEPEAKYLAWAHLQAQPALPPATRQLALGEQAFVTGPCALCHSIRGTEARGGVAPDLTHVGGRHMIAAGTLLNTRAHMQGWIVGAQTLKPGVRMPTIDSFDGRTLNAVAAYLESLK